MMLSSASPVGSIDLSRVNLNGMEIYISYDGDSLGNKVGRLALNDKIPELKTLSRRIEAGNDIFVSWCLAHGGELIGAAGDEGRFIISSTALDDLPRKREEYASTVGATVSIGVGMSLSDSDKALLLAKIRGKDRILFWNSDMEQEWKDAISAKFENKTEGQKIQEEYLTQKSELIKTQGPTPERPAQSAAPPVQPDASPLNSPGPSSPSHSLAELPPSPPQDDSQDDASQLADILNESDDGENNPPEDGPSAEDKMHAHAQMSEARKKSKESPQRKQLKEGVVEILKQVQAQAPKIDQIKQQDPDLYQSIMGVIQSMVSMAEELVGGSEEKKEEVAKDETSPHRETFHGGKGVKPLDLPVGSQLNGKLKVHHADSDKDGWVSVRSGEVLSADGHGISSRTPNGR